MDLRQNAHLAASAGRYGDDVLVHMSRDEVEDLNRLAMGAGIGSLTINPATGYPEAFSLGGLLKGLGSIVAPILGTAVAGPLGGALAGGLFTGVTEGSFKKGLLAGMGSYVGGKALSAAADVGKAAAAQGVSGQSGNLGTAIINGKEMALPAIQAIEPQIAQQAASRGLLERGADSLMSKLPSTGAGVNLGDVVRGGMAGAEAGIGSLLEGRAPFVLYPMMGELNAAIQAENDPNIFNRDRYIRDRLEQYRRATQGVQGGMYPSYAPVRRYSSGGPVTNADDHPYVQVPQLNSWDDTWTSFFNSYNTAMGDDGNYGRMNRIQEFMRPVYDRWMEEVARGGYDGLNDYFSSTSFDSLYRGSPDGFNNPVAYRDALSDFYRRHGGQIDRTTGDVDLGNGTGNTSSMVYNSTPQGYTPGYHGEHQYFLEPGQEPATPDMAGERFGLDPRQVSAGLSQTVNANMDDFLARLSGGNPLMGGPAVQPPASDNVALGPGAQTTMTTDQLIDEKVHGGGSRVRAPNTYAGGGIVSLKGGMSDTIPATIDGGQPARLSEGEFVIPADVVSMLGDGNTSAGAGELEDMLARIRLMKTGTPHQAPPTDFNVLPA